MGLLYQSMCVTYHFDKAMKKAGSVACFFLVRYNIYKFSRNGNDFAYCFSVNLFFHVNV